MTKEEVFQQCTIEGNVVKLPDVQLDRKLYLEVKKSFEQIGGKWKGGKTYGFVFDYCPAELLAKIANGEKQNLKKEFQFYATPDCLADELVSLADLNENDTILEPSAGRGAIVKAIHRELPHHTVCGFELMELNRNALQDIDHFELLGDDFLQCTTKWDKIVANPPFSKNQDIEHVTKMYHCLNQGGRLVSVTSPHWTFAEDKESVRFRDWLSDVSAEIIKIEPGRFKESGTMVGGMIVIINKH